MKLQRTETWRVKCTELIDGRISFELEMSSALPRFIGILFTYCIKEELVREGKKKMVSFSSSGKGKLSYFF